MSTYGTLTDHTTGEPIRAATDAEWLTSIRTGAFDTGNGRAVFVAGGPATEADEQVTTTQASRILGVATQSVRTILRRMGVEAVGRDIETGEKIWPAAPIRNRPPTRQGTRTDLTKGTPDA